VVVPSRDKSVAQWWFGGGGVGGGGEGGGGRLGGRLPFLTN